MDFPILLLVLVALPLLVAGLIVAVAGARRRSRGPVAENAGEPVHRFQADSATIQDSAVPAPIAPAAVESGRARRAASARLPKDH